MKRATIIETLECFNFGPGFISMIKTLLCYTESCVRNGGWLSSWFPTERGIRQGCAISPLLFILATEVLACRVRGDQNVELIEPLRDTGINFLQYADDATLLVSNNASAEIAFDIVEQFAMCSGLQLNREKSKGLAINIDPPVSLGITWIENGQILKILGIYFSQNVEISRIEENWKDKILNIKLLIERWKKRDLSLYGKVIIAKTFLLSQISYQMQCMHIPETVLKEVDRMIFGFIWKRRHANKKAFEKVKRTVLCQTLMSGGLGMISAKHQQKTFLIKRVKKLLIDSVYKQLTGDMTSRFVFSKCGGIKYFSECSSAFFKNNITAQIMSFFWQSVVSNWMDIKTTRYFDIDENDDVVLLKQPIYLNKYIRYKGKPLAPGRLMRLGIKYIFDIWDQESNSILSVQKVMERIDNMHNELLNVNAVINAFPAAWAQQLQRTTCREVEAARDKTQEIEDDIKTFLAKSNKEIRDYLVICQDTTMCGPSFWHRKYGMDVTTQFQAGIEATKESSLRVLNFKILHNIWPTNILLKKLKIKPSENCDHCQAKDYVEHFFFNCNKVKVFWNHVKRFIEDNIGIRIQIDEKTAIFGINTSTHNNIKNTNVLKINKILLLAKSCISKFRYGKCKNLIVIFEKEWEVRRNIKW